MTLQDYGQLRLAHPNKLDSIEDLVQEVRENATKELYADEPDGVEGAFAHAVASLHALRGKLRTLEGELHASFSSYQD